MENNTKLSVIICVYNEFKTIKLIIDKVLNAKLPNNIIKEIVIIDNNSTDGTKQILENFKENKDIKIFFNKENFGKGYSITKGIKKASGNYIIFQDADLEYDPNDYYNLINHLIKHDLDFVYGSRIIKNKKYHRYNLHKYVVIFYSFLINLLFKARFTDTATNYKLFKSHVIKNIKLTSKSFAIDFEITVKLVKRKYIYDEVPISYNPRSYDQGKKINVNDAFKSLLIIIKLFFSK